jgi:anti-sigma regulatory factor (Ser/Thr protein kinase)
VVVSTVVLPCAAASVAEGRRFVSALLYELGLDAQRHEAVLLTSELLTNSILHGQGEPRLDVRWEYPEVEIAVTDRGTWAPRRSALDLAATSGRGLQLLERVAERYGTRSSASGTTIWFTLRAPDREVPAPRETADPVLRSGC